MDKSARDSEDLVTEKDIDDQFGLFTDELPNSGLPNASERLAAAYPKHNYRRVSDGQSDRPE